MKGRNLRDAKLHTGSVMSGFNSNT
jgi:hypothetical protein